MKSSEFTKLLYKRRMQVDIHMLCMFSIVKLSKKQQRNTCLLIIYGANDNRPEDKIGLCTFKYLFVLM